MKNKNLKTVNGQLISKMGFSFVELIIVISIIALISVIGVSINSNYTEKTKNSKISSDIVTIKSSLESYNNENKKLPDPKGNQKFFDDSSNYVHYDDATAFGVYGNITEDTIPKKYMNFTPIDPRTNQYYAYGKTITGAPMFQLSGVNKINGIYESKVVGNYTGETGPYNLIREYNGPDFVFDQSTNSFPYNPEEKVLKGKIGTYNGLVTVNGKTIDKTRIKNNDLISGDVIEVAAGAEAQIHYSDGSKSYLGDPSKPSKLTLANMIYKDENNLFTKIQLALDFGSIWTKTSKLDPNSDFEIYTTDTEAAVRGTIFGVSKTQLSTTTDVIVIEGKVNISKITGVNSANLVDKINSDNITYSTSPVPFDLAPTGGNPVKYDGTNQTTVSVGSLPNLADEDGLTNITPKIKSINAGDVVLEFPSSFSGTSNGKKVYKNTAILANSDYEFNLNQLTLSGTIAESNYIIKVCDATGIKCTREVSINKTVTYGDVPTITSLCSGDEIEFSGYYNDCIDQDDSLVASGYHLVAYAPYDGNYFLYYNTGASRVNNGWTNNVSSYFQNIDGANYGIFLTGSNTDSIRYTGINSLVGTDFAIEMNVLGKDLKRSGNYLFDTDSSKNIKSYLQSGLLKSRVASTIIQTSSPILLIDTNYYKVIFKTNTKQYIEISNSIYNSSGTLTPTSLGDTLFIGSSITPTNLSPQWNGIIDYVKIYKK